MIRETKRLILRRFNDNDVSRVTELLVDGEVFKTTQNVPHPYTEQMAKDWIKMHDVWYATKHQYNLAVVLKDANVLIGTVSLSNQDGVGELGYWFGKEYWNKGYGTEATEALFDYAFNDLYFHRIYGKFLVSNPASGRIMEKVNMTKEGTLREHLKKEGNYLDIDVYGILRSEYDLKVAKE